MEQNDKSLVAQERQQGLAQFAQVVEQTKFTVLDVWLSESEKQIYSTDMGDSFKPFGIGARELARKAGLHIEQLRTVNVDGTERTAPYIEREGGREIAHHFRVLGVGMRSLGDLVIAQFPIIYKVSGYLAEAIQKYLYKVTKVKTGEKWEDSGKDKYAEKMVLIENRGGIVSASAKELVIEEIRARKGWPAEFALTGGLVAVLDTKIPDFGEFFGAVTSIEKFSQLNFESKSYRRVVEAMLGAEAVPVEVEYIVHGKKETKAKYKDARKSDRDARAHFRVTHFEMPPVVKTLVVQLAKALANGEAQVAERFIEQITLAGVDVHRESRKPIVEAGEDAPKPAPASKPKEDVLADAVEAEFTEEYPPAGDELFEAPQAKPEPKAPAFKYDNTPEDFMAWLYWVYKTSYEEFLNELGELGIPELPPGSDSDFICSDADFTEYARGSFDRKISGALARKFGYYKNMKAAKANG